MKIICVLLEFVAYHIERRRMCSFLHAHGNTYCLEHKVEWMKYAESNWASRISHRHLVGDINAETIVENKPIPRGA